MPFAPNPFTLRVKLRSQVAMQHLDLPPSWAAFEAGRAARQREWQARKYRRECAEACREALRLLEKAAGSASPPEAETTKADGRSASASPRGSTVAMSAPAGAEGPPVGAASSSLERRPAAARTPAPHASRTPPLPGRPASASAPTPVLWVWMGGRG